MSLGVKGGVPISRSAGTDNESRRYTIGPSIEFRLPANFAVEAAALYQRIGYSYSYNVNWIDAGAASLDSGCLCGVLTAIPTSVTSRTRANSWRFPILGKYYIRSRSSHWQPFLGTGYAFETSWTHSESSTVTNGVLSTFKYDHRTDLNVGAVAAAGVRIRAGRFAVLPELRFTRWGQGGVSTRRNEGTFLLGIQF